MCNIVDFMIIVPCAARRLGFVFTLPVPPAASSTCIERDIRVCHFSFYVQACTAFVCARAHVYVCAVQKKPGCAPAKCLLSLSLALSPPVSFYRRLFIAALLALTLSLSPLSPLSFLSCIIAFLQRHDYSSIPSSPSSS